MWVQWFCVGGDDVGYGLRRWFGGGGCESSVPGACAGRGGQSWGVFECGDGDDGCAGWPRHGEGRADGALPRRPERRSVPDQRRVAAGADRRPDGVGRRAVLRESARARVQHRVDQPAVQQLHGVPGGREHVGRHSPVHDAGRLLDAERGVLRARRPDASPGRATTASSCSSIRPRQAAGSARWSATASTRIAPTVSTSARRYKDFPNIIWMHGNDYQDWGPTNDPYVTAVAQGIRDVDPQSSADGRAELPRQRVARRPGLGAAHRPQRLLHLRARRISRCSRTTTGAISSRRSWSRRATSSSRTPRVPPAHRNS